MVDYSKQFVVIDDGPADLTPEQLKAAVDFARGKTARRLEVAERMAQALSDCLRWMPPQGLFERYGLDASTFVRHVAAAREVRAEWEALK